MTMPTVQQLATEARAGNAANGWGTTFRFADVPNYLALIHSEVTEAVTADTTSQTIRELGTSSSGL
ncbi:hypothetical protein [Deinococcus sp. QL22]|uniref:hypothetical protein n=1 Tax=Deinococcus sp. QL22 TaxID=2939437 RepID=UPI0020183AD6|nr:hypothetical protein [Deinococcus sp. QL22]UQN09283.1 hypothetical protein M1R55_22170 [Deinococcus sp. QL22]